MNINWCAHDIEQLARFRLDKMGHKRIARKMGRSPASISRKCQELGLVRGRPPERPPFIIQQVTIPHSDVPEWYAAGWRFIGFNEGLCVFEWKSERDIRWPKNARIIALDTERGSV